MNRNKHLLLWASLGTLALLGWAAYAENALQEWRSVQRDYRAALTPEGREGFAIQLRQLVIPDLGVTDRCVTCHLGMAPGEAGHAGDPLFRPHPDVYHDPSRFGCTICHGGQGRATASADAHGTVAHWPEPMIPPAMSGAGCGTCHTHLAVPNLQHLRRGRDLFERYDCLACHRMEGRGGTLRPGGAGGMEGPDLSRCGGVGYDRLWYRKHMARREAEAEGPWRQSFREIPTSDRLSLDAFLSSRVGAPGLMEAKALFHTLGCRGCHMVNGVGGDDGPDLGAEGLRDPGQLDFSHVPGEGRSLSAWLAQHFRAPAALVPESAMPPLGLAEAEIRLLTLYMLSLRQREFPGGYWPRDRVRAEHFGEREFAVDGATLYGTFCAACHGERGQGMRYPGTAAFPAIANPDFLVLATDEFLLETIRQGRPGTRMPAWGEKEGGLRPAEVEELAAYVRQIGGGAGPAPDPRPRRWVEAEPAAGRRLYETSCAACHGSQGEGKEGPAIGNRAFLALASDTYLVESIRRGRRGTSMPAFTDPSPSRATLTLPEIESIVAYLRQWEE